MERVVTLMAYGSETNHMMKVIRQDERIRGNQGLIYTQDISIESVALPDYEWGVLYLRGTNKALDNKPFCTIRDGVNIMDLLLKIHGKKMNVGWKKL